MLFLDPDTGQGLAFPQCLWNFQNLHLSQIRTWSNNSANVLENSQKYFFCPRCRLYPCPRGHNTTWWAAKDPFYDDIDDESWCWWWGGWRWCWWWWCRWGTSPWGSTSCVGRRSMTRVWFSSPLASTSLYNALITLVSLTLSHIYEAPAQIGYILNNLK